MIWFLPLAMAAAAATAKGIQAATQKDASDYMGEQRRHLLLANDQNTAGGNVGSYQMYDPEQNRSLTLVDRGSNSDTFSSLNDPNSATSRAFSLGGSPEAAAQIANQFRTNAENAYGMRGARIDTGAEDAIAMQQMGLASAYRNQMLGNAPSVAELQSNYAQQSNIQNAALAGTMGGNASRRAAIMRAGAAGSSLASQGAAQRSQESNDAAGKLGSLQGSMSNMAMNRALTQANLDSQVADYADQMANRYYGLQQAALDSQTKAQRQRGAALQQADQGRKDEVFGSAQGAANRHNNNVNAVLGSVQAGLSSAGSLAQGLGGGK